MIYGVHKLPSWASKADGWYLDDDGFPTREIKRVANFATGPRIIILGKEEATDECSSS